MGVGIGIKLEQWVWEITRDAYLCCRVRNRTRSNTPIHPVFLRIIFSLWWACTGGSASLCAIVRLIDVIFCRRWQCEYMFESLEDNRSVTHVRQPGMVNKNWGMYVPSQGVYL